MSFLVAVKLKTSCSFRAISKYLITMNIYYNIALKVPSHVTICNWVKKVGYYQLSMPKEIGDDWVIIIDESIQIGAEKLLLILGIRSKNIDFSRPLNFPDVLPIVHICKSGWNAHKVRDELKKAQGILGHIKYAVSDKGASINKGLELCGIPHVHDITHRIGNILKKVYKKDSAFKYYIDKIASLRLQIQQTKWAYLLPPQQRSQSRFLNLKPIMEWGTKILDYIKKEEYQDEPLEMKAKLQWILTQDAFIKEINQILDIIDKIFKLLKYKGLSKESKILCSQYLNELRSARGKMVKKEILHYLKEVRATVEGEKRILCTSDIIESSFGLYKNSISKNALNGITNLSLCISANTNKMAPSDMKQIMEKVETKMINKWTQENIGESILKRRQKAFRKTNGVKNNFEKAA